MDLSPNDIRNFEFGTQMRGYDKEEVEQFQEQVASILEQVKQENLRLSMEVESLNSQLTGLRQFEDTIKSAAIDARRNADNTMAKAREDAEQLLSNAKKEADEAIGSKADKVRQIESQIEKLELARKSYMRKLSDLIKSHVQLVGEIAGLDSPELPSPLPNDIISTSSESHGSIEVTDSTEVTRDVVETIVDKSTDKDEDEQGESLMTPHSIVESSPKDSDDSDETEAEVDPELAAALESYAHDSGNAQTSLTSDDEPTSPPKKRPPPPGTVVATNSLAGDIPSGYITKEGDQKGDKQITDKINVDEPTDSERTEHNSIDPESDKNNESSMSPEVLASELDEVVAKFEKTMDEAAQK